MNIKIVGAAGGEVTGSAYFVLRRTKRSAPEVFTPRHLKTKSDPYSW
jgi:hypothetical protein